ncbi:hypothetical protein [Fructobacillus parabroussonetiae]|uniref:Uncharacterized protein n=1 Tax=Fructobacillus parabroussonetiae TaxID=2713174 RepID=A0ABS5QVD5_9LACO|nr:hypothetical protein [Fructobacillus parabroussonetiae]MBS9337159.1 hypothetical protein [Fructobacillus parabroussonetiae]
MIKITSFHGTSVKNAEKILEEGFKIKQDSGQYPNDLGHGIYGYIDSDFSINDVEFINDAKTNAKSFSKYIRGNKENYAILQFKVSVFDDQILNLNQLNQRNRMVRLYKQFLNSAISEIPLKYKTNRASRRKQMDGVFIEFLIEHNILREPEMIILDTYSRFNGYASNITNGRELLIRNLNRMTDIERVYL